MVFRRRRPPEPGPLDGVDVGAVSPRYRTSVSDALDAWRQFDELVAGVRPGPLQDRLGELRRRVDAGVLAVWGTTTKATELERVVGTLDPDRVAAELKQARRQDADPAAVDALAARFASTQRLLNALDDLRTGLPLLEARLGTAVARAGGYRRVATPGGRAILRWSA